jgi:peptidyl-tRNA hydrolase, PTH1 family
VADVTLNEGTRGFERRDPGQDRVDGIPVIRLVAGLGNPGAEYESTRHNVGFMVLDRVAREWGRPFVPFGRLALIAGIERDAFRGCLLKPLTYMNRSGRAVGDWAGCELCTPGNILVVSDDLNLPLGRLRFRKRGSSGGHNGLDSIIRTLGSDDFPRLRCGIGISRVADDDEPSSADLAVARPPGVRDFVLEPFLASEEDAVGTLIDRASKAVQLWIETGDLDLCMNRFN